MNGENSRAKRNTPNIIREVSSLSETQIIPIRKGQYRSARDFRIGLTAAVQLYNSTTRSEAACRVSSGTAETVQLGAVMLSARTNTCLRYK